MVEKVPAELLVPIKRAKYPAVSEKEERISVPLQARPLPFSRQQPIFNATFICYLTRLWTLFANPTNYTRVFLSNRTSTIC